MRIDRLIAEEAQEELGVGEITKILAHRYPMLLLDKVFVLKGGKEAVGIKNVTVNEPFFVGHFPQNPIMPGLLIVEAMAQTGGIIHLRYKGAKATGLTAPFVGLDKVRFKKPVVPGDVLKMHVTLIKERLGMLVYRGESWVGDVKVVEADMKGAALNSSYVE